MVDRSVKVSLVAEVNGYISGMQKAAAQTKMLGSESEKLAQKKEALGSLAKGFTVVGAVAAAGVGLAIKTMADFEAQMAQVQSLSHASTSEMTKLSEAALTVGQGIGFSATEVAEAETELVKAGVSVTDQLNGGLKGALDLAAAGQMDVADATSIAASAMTQFGLKGKDVPHIADLLAAGADKALGSVSDLGQGLKYVGPVAASMGVSIDQTVGTLAELAQNGILADQAGTSLRGVLQSLTSPSSKAAEVMQRYNISIYDAQGNFIGLNGVAEQLKTHLGGLSQATRNQALGQIFGNEQITAATVLMKGGASAVDKWTNSVNDNGFAAEQAAGKMNSLNGDVKKLQAAWETGLIRTGQSSDGVLRGMIQSVTGLIQAYNNAPSSVQGLVLAFGATVAVVGLAGGAFLGLVPKIAAAKIAMETLGISASSMKSSLGSAASFMGGPWGLAITGAVAIGALFVQTQVQAAQRTAQLKSTLDETTGAVTKSTRAMVAQNLATKGTFLGIDVGPSALDQAKKAGLSLQTVTKAAEGSDTAYKRLKASYKDLMDARSAGDSKANEAAFAAQDVVKAVDQQRSSLKGAQSQQKLLNEAQKDSKSSSDSAASGLSSVADAADDANGSISEVTAAIKGFNSTTLDSRSTERDFEASLLAATQALKDNGAALNAQKTDFNTATDAGQKNQAAVDGIAQSALNHASALYAETGSQEQATAALNTGRDALVKALGQYGITGQAAQAYATKVMGTPKSWATLFSNNSGSAGAQVDSYKGKLHSIPGLITTKVDADTWNAQNKISNLIAMNDGKIIHIQVQTTNGGSSTSSVGGLTRAGGGPIVGPGTATSDSITARLSNGEFVIKAAAVAKYGYGFLHAVNSGTFAPGFADGGLVTKTYMPSAPSTSVNVAAPTIPAPVVEVSFNGADLSQFVDIRVNGALQREVRARSNGSRGL